MKTFQIKQSVERFQELYFVVFSCNCLKILTNLNKKLQKPFKKVKIQLKLATQSHLL